MRTLPIDLMHDGLQDLAHLFGVGEFSVEQLGNVSQAHVLAGKLFIGQNADAASALDLVTFKWPGYNQDDNLPYQFIEKEYMLQDRPDLLEKTALQLAYFGY